MRRSCANDQDGTVVIFALVFIAAWAVVIFAVLDFAAVGYEVASSGRDRTVDVYLADTAVEAVIGYLAADVTGEACSDDWDTSDTHSVSVNGSTVTVSCRMFLLPGNVRIADVAAVVQGSDGEPGVLARVRFDHDNDSGALEAVSVEHWMVQR